MRGRIAKSRSGRDSDKLRREAIDFAGIGTGRYDMDGIILDIDANALAILGLPDRSPEDVIGEHIESLVVYRQPHVSIRERIRDTGGIHNLEIPFSTLSGEERWVLCDTYRVVDEESGRDAVQAVLRDITDRKRADLALQAERQRLAITLASIGDGVIATDAEGRVSLMNEVAERLTGAKRDQVLGMPLDEIYQVRSPQGEDGSAAGRRIYILSARDGTERYISSTVTPICVADQAPMGEVIVFRDITSRRAAQQRLRKRAELEMKIAAICGGFVGVPIDKVDESIGAGLKEFCRAIKADEGFVYLLDRPSGGTCVAAHSRAPRKEVPIAPFYDGAQAPWISSKAGGTRPVCLRSLDELPKSARKDRALLKQLGWKSLLIVPARAADNSTLLLALGSKTRPREWEQEVVPLAESIAHAFLHALCYKRAGEVARQYIQELAILNKVIATANSVADGRALMKYLATIVYDLLEFDGVAVYLNDERRSAELVAAVGLDEEKADLISTLDMADRPYRDVCAGGRSLVESAVSADAYPKVHALGFRAFVAVPLVARGQIYGALVGASIEPKVFRPEKRQILESIGREAAAALSKTRTEEALRQSEHRLQLALHGASCDVWDWNLNSQQMHIGTRWCETLGYGRVDLSDTYTVFRHLLHPDDAPRFERELQRHLRGETEAFRLEYRLRTPDNRYLWFQTEGRIVAYDDVNRPARMAGTIKCIHEQKRAELELRIKDRAIASAVSAIIIADMEGVLTYANDAAIRMWGYDSQAEVLSRSSYEFWEDQRNVDLIFRILMSERGSWTGEATARRKDGSTFLCMLSIGISRDADGTPLCIMASAIDVSVLKQTQSQLQYRADLERIIATLSGRFIGLASDAIGDGIDEALARVGEFVDADRCIFLVAGPDRRSVKLLHEWCRGGINSVGPWLQGHPLSNFSWIINRLAQDEHVYLPNLDSLPPSADEERKHLEDDRTVSALFAPVHYERRLYGVLCLTSLTKDLEFSEDTIALLRLVGEIIASALQRRQAEDELRRRVELQSFIADIAGMFVSVELGEVDARIEQALGLVGRFASADRCYVALIGKNDSVGFAIEWCDEGIQSQINAVHGREVNEFPWAWEQLVKSGVLHIPSVAALGGEAAFEKQLLESQDIKSLVNVPLMSGKDFFGYFGLDAVRLERDWGEETVAMLKIVGQVIARALERKRAEEEQARLEMQMLHAQKLESLGVLAGGIAHDFNNLLMGMLGNANVALMQLPLDSSARESMEQVEQAAMHAAELTNQLLAYSGKGQFVIRPINLTDLVSEMVKLLRTAVSKKVAFECNLDSSLPLVLADATQLRQVIMNLVINASEAIGDTQGSITIETARRYIDGNTSAYTYTNDELAPGEYVSVAVSDTGCGMTRETLARIFDPFFTTKFTGRGLGLAAVLGIIRGHRGALRVESEVGRGTSFQVLLPVAREDEVEEHVAVRVAENGTAQSYFTLP